MLRGSVTHAEPRLEVLSRRILVCGRRPRGGRTTEARREPLLVRRSLAAGPAMGRSRPVEVTKAPQGLPGVDETREEGLVEAEVFLLTAEHQEVMVARAVAAPASRPADRAEDSQEDHLGIHRGARQADRQEAVQAGLRVGPAGVDPMDHRGQVGTLVGLEAVAPAEAGQVIQAVVAQAVRGIQVADCQLEALEGTGEPQTR